VELFCRVHQEGTGGTVSAEQGRTVLRSIRRVSAVGVVLGLGLGMIAAPALANDKHHGDRSSDVWGLNVAGEDGPAWGLTVTGHGPAWGVHVDDDDEFDMPIVFDDDVLGDDGSGWDMGLSAYGIDAASWTGDNPAADFYLGQPGFNSTDGWDNDRQGWLGGLLGDDQWVIGGLW
jgi:hypothetical protein